MQALASPRETLVVLAGTAGATAVALVVLGWSTEIRQVTHGLILTLAIAAFFPFVLFAAGLALGLAVIGMGITAGMLGGGDFPPLPGPDLFPVEVAGWLAPRYYGFWARRRHPVLWGVVLGAVAGSLVLGGLIAILVLPGEAATVQRLNEVQRRIDDAYKERGRYPAATAHDQLTDAALADKPGARNSAIVDGFGRPLVYRIRGVARIASYSVSSLGFDGKPGHDDLCVAGQTRMMAAAELVGRAARVVEFQRGTTAQAIVNKLRGIQSLQCAR